MSKNLCVIPARGGSKRIPRKNIRPFLGKPIIAYSIEVALDSGLFEEVMVSTDDNEIAEIAIRYGAKVPFFRSEQNSDDFTPLKDVIKEVKENYTKRGVMFDFICCLFPTAPLVTVELLHSCYQFLRENPEADSVRPIVKFSYPIQRALGLENHIIKMVNEEHIFTRTQDLDECYHDAGQFYWMKFQSGMEGEVKAGVVISHIECQDIDNEDDWKLAELKYKLQNS